MHKQELTEFLEMQGIPFEADVNLAEKTWIGFGSTVSFWVVPQNKDELIRVVQFLNLRRIPFDPVGATSNCVFSKDENYFCIVSTCKVTGAVFCRQTAKIICACGEPLSRLVKKAVEEGAGGWAGLIGIPGTVGAAVINNSGAGGDRIGSIIRRVEILQADGTVRWVCHEEMDYSTRSSAIKTGRIRAVVLSIEFNWIPVDAEGEKKRMVCVIDARKKRQEQKYRNLGSIFATEKGLYRDIGETHVFYKIAVRVIAAAGWRLLCVFPKLPLARILNRVTFFFFPGKVARPVVADHDINCFLRVPGATEQDFFDYVQWIQGLTGGKVPLEVQIKKSHKTE